MLDMRIYSRRARRIQGNFFGQWADFSSASCPPALVGVYTTPIKAGGEATDDNQNSAWIEFPSEDDAIFDRVVLTEGWNRNHLFAIQHPKSQGVRSIVPLAPFLEPVTECRRINTAIMGGRANQLFETGAVGGVSRRRFVAARRQNATNRRQESPPTTKTDRP
jgi:hypothetical protein